MMRHRIDGPGAYRDICVPPGTVMFVAVEDDADEWVGVFMSARVVVEAGPVDRAEQAWQRAERRLRERTP